jgi:hypothetical protein
MFSDQKKGVVVYSGSPRSETAFEKKEVVSRLHQA